MRWFLVCLVVGGLADHDAWFSESYDMTFRRVADKRWAESDNKTGKIKWHLEETARTDKHVQLFNPKTQQALRLSADRIEVRKGEKWEWIGKGHWIESKPTNPNHPASKPYVEAKPKQPQRQWASEDGKYSVKAQLVGFSPQGLVLKTNDNRLIYVPVGKLGDADRRYAREVYADTPGRPSFGCAFLDVLTARRVFREAGLEPPVMRRGVFIAKVLEGGPAEDAGVQPLDFITHVNDHAINNLDDLNDLVMSLSAGDACEVKLRHPAEIAAKTTWRSLTVKLTLIEKSRLDELVAAEKVAAEKRRIADSKKCPLEITGYLLKDNVIGIPQLTLKLKNIRGSNAVAYSIVAECYNNFDEKVTNLSGSNIFRGIGQVTIPSENERTVSWQLSLFDTATKAIVRIDRVKLQDGFEWNGSMESVTVRMDK